MHKFSHLWWKSLDGKFVNIAQSTHYGGGQEHRLWVMPYVAKRRLENEKTLKKEASKCKKINSFFTKSSWKTRGETCGEGPLHQRILGRNWGHYYYKWCHHNT